MTKSPYNIVSDERLEQLKRWLVSQGYGIDTLTPMSADAGFRRYFRLQTDSGSRVAVDAPPQYEDTESFISIAHTLQKSGLLTPAVHCYNLEKGFMLLSDLGSLHLQDAATPGNIQSARPHYTRALHTLIKIQSETPITNLPAYTADFLRQELDLFPQWYLHTHLHHNCSTAVSNQIQRCFDLCIESACEQPKVFVHRDYHCRNLMIQPDHTIGIIDFQGALYGPVTYDLVSLLRDAYVEWPVEFLQPLLDLHFDWLSRSLPDNNKADKPTRQTYQRWFDLMGLQRHLKILGIFCRLHYRDGKSHYLDNIPLVRKHILNVCRQYSEFAVLEELLTTCPQNQSPADAS